MKGISLDNLLTHLETGLSKEERIECTNVKIGIEYNPDKTEGNFIFPLRIKYTGDVYITQDGSKCSLESKDKSFKANLSCTDELNFFFSKIGNHRLLLGVENSSTDYKPIIISIKTNENSKIYH